VEWTTQSERQPYNGERTRNGNGEGAHAGGNGVDTQIADAGGNGADTQIAPPGGNGVDTQSTQPLPPIPASVPPASMPAPPASMPAPGNSTAVNPAAVPAPPAHHAPAPQATSGYDHCPNCGAAVTGDQRYCLSCGQRRGEPRLPFMDAVVFMDAMKAPQGAQAAAPPPRKPRKISPNAALIAGVGTLLLALGIGVLIGRSGNDTAAAPQQAPIVIKGGTGGTEETATPSGAGETIGGGGNNAGKSKKAIKKENEAAAASGEGAKEILKPSGNVKLPPAKTGVGDKCEKGTAGCQGGEFTGGFFE
jgi:hypothetical protein